MEKTYQKIEGMIQSALKEKEWNKEDAYSMALNTLKEIEKLPKNDEKRSGYLNMTNGLLIDLAGLNNDIEAAIKHFMHYNSDINQFLYSLNPHLFMIRSFINTREVYKEKGQEFVEKIFSKLNDIKNDEKLPKPLRDGLLEHKFLMGLEVEKIKYYLSIGEHKKAFEIAKENNLLDSFKQILQTEVNILDIIQVKILKQDKNNISLHKIDKLKLAEYPRLAHKFKIGSIFIKNLYKPTFFERFFR